MTGVSSDFSHVLVRVAKLLRLSESANPHEAATAAAHAQRLIDLHRLDASGIESEMAGQGQGQGQDQEQDPRILVASERPIDASKRLRDWKILLAQTVGQHNASRVQLFERAKPSGRGVEMRELIAVGMAEDIEATRVVYDALVHAVEMLCLAHGSQRSRAWRDSFRIGVVAAVEERSHASGGASVLGLGQAGSERGPVEVVPARLGRARADVQRRLAAVDSWLALRGPAGQDGQPVQSRPIRVLAGAHDFGQFAGRLLSAASERRPDTRAPVRKRSRRRPPS